MKVNFRFLEEHHSVEIERSHYLRRLGFPKDYEVTEHVWESMDWSSQWYYENGNAWLQVYELDTDLNKGQLYLNNKATEAPKIYKRFYKHNVKKAMLIAATAGDTIDAKTKELWSTDYPDRSYFLEIFASCVTESLVVFAVDQIKYWADQKQEQALSRYSPGYPGWELKEQNTLMELMQGFSNEIPLSVSETSLLLPLKSQLSLVGIYKGEQKEKSINIECMQCNFNNCTCRKKEMYIKI